MSGRPLLTLSALAVAGAGGYYFYNAGGNANVAGKQIEHDAAKLSARVKGDLPGSEKEAKTGLKLSAEQAGAKVDNSVDYLKQQGNKLSSQASSYGKDAEKKLEDTRKETGASLTKAVDKFDSSVEKGASQAKSGISSWFGGSK